MTHGEIWTIDFGQPVGSLPSKIRPAVVMQNDLLGIKDLNTVVVIPFTSNLDRADFEPNILIEKEETGLSKDSVAVIHLIGAVNKFCLERKCQNFAKKTIRSLWKLW
ncbi:type II toxin-antitoxin system PemK/MazF family toxin [Treponema vincentii]|uniref:type II toxin-antitoxin system PemK/MazF family toxin n=1 Tax=Treponema vincentii TaxID=69710 RepID=UPI0020A2BB87|nr:type II toxin-antitoxin system PemK/MazF family toxin [Treponema vincentii]